LNEGFGVWEAKATEKWMEILFELGNIFDGCCADLSFEYYLINLIVKAE
jgi:hypothetical protein